MFETTINKAIKILLAIAAAMLAVMMFLTAFDVLGRYIFNRPISGALELVEYIMAIFVSFSIVYCEAKKGHVTVSFLMTRFSSNVQSFVNFLNTALVTFLTLLVFWQNILYIKMIYLSKLASPVLLIPTYPFVVAVALGFGLLAFILIIHTLEFATEVKK